MDKNLSFRSLSMKFFKKNTKLKINSSFKMYPPCFQSDMILFHNFLLWQASIGFKELISVNNKNTPYTDNEKPKFAPSGGKF